MHNLSYSDIHNMADLFNGVGSKIVSIYELAKRFGNSELALQISDLQMELAKIQSKYADLQMENTALKTENATLKEKLEGNRSGVMFGRAVRG